MDNPSKHPAPSKPSIKSSAGATADLVNHGEFNSSKHFPAFRGRSKSTTWTSDSHNSVQPFTSNVPYKSKLWEPTLEKAIKAIVSIKASHVRSFDSETSGDYTATGFIVDAARGIILTNRHVVSPAPIVAQAVLTNYEEVDLIPIYRDPVHDFGFMKFDPKRIHFMELDDIPLCPDKAKVGLDIRVVGNDAGEKLSILAGTLARLDRKAPDYGVGEYNDFNTFYLQAASGTSGGSSGSPVLDIDGHAIALNAGGASKSSSSYYLPLNRVVRALEYIQQDKVVPRGTLQTEFEYLPYNEIRRLGLKSKVEERIRSKFPEETGMLIVNSVLPQGPADNILVPGDIVIGCNGKMVPHFIALFSILDDSVGKEVSLTISRGRKVQDVSLIVQDLHSITPDRFVEVGGSIVHELSYQLAKSFSQPVGGVYVATSGHMLSNANVWRKSIIISVNNVPTPHLDDFVNVIKGLSDGARVPIRRNTHWVIDQTGLWDYTEMPPAPIAIPHTPSTASFPSLDPSMALAEKLMPSFVAIDFCLPYLIDGMKVTQFYGIGFVLSTTPPLILCDRDTIPIGLGDTYITFANSIIIPGKIVFLHPFYNYVMLTYDPALIDETTVKPIEFSTVELYQGDQTQFVGLGTDHSAIQKSVSVSSVSNIGTRECSPPRWRAMNVEGIKIDDLVDSPGGVLTDREGRAHAFWLSHSSQNERGKEISFMSGLSVSLIKPTLDQCRQGLPMVFKGLNAEFWTMRIAAARSLGLSDEWVQKIEKSRSTRHTLLYVLNILDESQAQVLCVGDIILTINEKIINRMPQFLQEEDGYVEMVVLRDCKELKVNVALSEQSGFETTRVIGWQGALIQMPYRSVLEQVRNVPSGVYVSCTLYGSPASNVLRPGVWIIEVQGEPIKDLDQFIQIINNFEKKQLSNKNKKEITETDSDSEEDGDGYIRIKTVSRNEIVRVAALKLDTHYWDSWQLIRDERHVCGWSFEQV